MTDALPTDAGTSWSVSPARPGCSISAGTLRCDFGTLTRGASASVHVVSPTTTATCGTVSNSASVTSRGAGAASVGPVNVTVTCPPTADVSVVKAALDDSISAGETAQFDITVANSGADAFNAALSDLLPAGLGWTLTTPTQGCSIVGQTLTCDFGTLAPGASIEVSVAAIASADDCGTITNTATVSASNEPAANSANNQSSASITIACP